MDDKTIAMRELAAREARSYQDKGGRLNGPDVAEPPIIVNRLDDAYKVDLKPSGVVLTGKPHIPVTDEMLSAGVAELGKHTYNHSHAEICEAVFKAMLDKVNDDGKRYCEHCGYRVRMPCTSQTQRLNCHNY